MHACTRSWFVLAVGFCFSLGAAAVSGGATLDPAWGTAGSGAVYVPFDVVSDGKDVVNDAVGLPDGSTILVGRAQVQVGGAADFAILKLGPDGLPASGFGSTGTGKVVYGNASAEEASSVAIDPQGSLLVAGYRKLADDNTDFLVCRFNASTGLAVNFAGGASSCAAVAFDIPVANGTHQDKATDIIVSADGKITLVGTAEAQAGSVFGAIARLLPNGEPDMGFGTSGGLFFRPTGFTQMQLSAVRYASNGKLVVVGQASDINGKWYGARARFAANGTYDSSGQLFFSAMNQWTWVDDMVLVDDPNSVEDATVVVGRANIVGAVIAKMPGSFINSLDTAFGASSGYTATDFGQSFAQFKAVTARPGGGFVAVGQVCGSSCGMSVAAFTADGMPDVSFNSPSGEFAYNFGTTAIAYAVVPQGGGVVVAGHAASATKTETDMFAIKLRIDSIFADGFELQ